MPGGPYAVGRGGESEELLGRWFARSGRRDEVFLATKAGAGLTSLDGIWGDDETPDWPLGRSRFEGAAADTLRTAIDDSLRRLGTDHVDLFYVHVDDLATPLEETLEALAGIVAAGKTRYIGWSNVRTWRLERVRQLCAAPRLAAPVRPAATALLPAPPGWPAHPVNRRRRTARLPACTPRRHVGVVLAHSQGHLRRPGQAARSPDDGVLRGSRADARIAVLGQLAAEIGVTPNQLSSPGYCTRHRTRWCR